MIGIYQIRNKVNGKTYIGQSINISKRIKEHFWKARYKKDVSYNSAQLKHTKDLCEAKRKPMKNSEFLELNLKDENHSLFGRCRVNNSENYFYFSMCDYEAIMDYCCEEKIQRRRTCKIEIRTSYWMERKSW